MKIARIWRAVEGLGDRDRKRTSLWGGQIVAKAVWPTSSRRFCPYQPALGIDVALEEIAKVAGRLFDRDAVESRRAVFESGFNFASIATSDVQTFN